jgi:hypothetical protein
MAKGSTTTYGGWEVLYCDGCGERIVKSGPKARGAMYRFGPPARSRHADCKWKPVSAA